MRNPMYVESWFKDMLSSYQALTNMDSIRSQKRKNNSVTRSPWLNLIDLLRIKQIFSQKEMAQANLLQHGAINFAPLFFS